jgi:hypothetical protein
MYWPKPKTESCNIMEAEIQVVLRQGNLDIVRRKHNWPE